MHGSMDDRDLKRHRFEEEELVAPMHMLSALPAVGVEIEASASAVPVMASAEPAVVAAEVTATAIQEPAAPTPEPHSNAIDITVTPMATVRAEAIGSAGLHVGATARAIGVDASVSHGKPIGSLEPPAPHNKPKSDSLYTSKDGVKRKSKSGPTKCEDCSLKYASFGTELERRRRWCARCAKTLHVGAISLQVSSATVPFCCTPLSHPYRTTQWKQNRIHGVGLRAGTV